MPLYHILKFKMDVKVCFGVCHLKNHLKVKDIVVQLVNFIC